MQSKVAIMNGNAGSSPVKKDEGGEKAKTPPSTKNNEEDLSFTKKALILAFFVITVLIGYFLPDGPSKITYLGLTVIAVFHIYLIVVAIIEKHVGNTTIFLAKAWFVLLVVGWFFPGPTWQAWEDVKGWRNERKDQTSFFSKSATAAGPELTPAQLNAKRLTELSNVPHTDVVVPVGFAVVATPPAGYQMSSIDSHQVPVIANITDMTSNRVWKQIDVSVPNIQGARDLYNKKFVLFQPPGAMTPTSVTVWWKKS